MKRDPYTTVGFAVTQQRDFFGRRVRHTERLENVDQLIEALAIDEGREKSFASAIVNVVKSAQLAIVAQSFAQQLLVIAICSARLARGWTTRLHRRVWR